MTTTSTSAFERSHTIEIQAPAAAVFDYVSNPQSWPEWIAASHQIDSDDRPLVIGETFREQWHTSKGAVELNWVVEVCDRPLRWVARTNTDFIGPIVADYTFVERDGTTAYTRMIRNPERPKPPTEAMIERIDDEATISLQNIKRHVERRHADGTLPVGP